MPECRTEGIELHPEHLSYQPGGSTIEQWYTDGYERDDPNGPAPEILRRLNLFHAMTNQGFSQNRSRVIVNWLMRCKGKYKEFNDRTRRPRGPSRWKKHDGDGFRSEKTSQTTGIDAVRHFDLRESVDTMSSQASTCIASSEQEDEDEEMDTAEEPTEEELDLLFGSTAVQSVGDPLNKDAIEERYYHTLLRRLRFFEIVYDDQLPPDNPSLEFDYTKGPFPRAIRFRKTQGHLPVQEMIVNGEKYDMEDLTNGHFVGEPGEFLTDNEIHEYERTNAAKVNKCRDEESERDFKTANPSRFSFGHRETWKEIAEARRIKEAEQVSEIAPDEAA